MGRPKVELFDRVIQVPMKRRELNDCILACAAAAQICKKNDESSEKWTALHEHLMTVRNKWDREHTSKCFVVDAVDNL